MPHWTLIYFLNKPNIYENAVLKKRVCIILCAKKQTYKITLYILIRVGKFLDFFILVLILEIWCCPHPCLILKLEKYAALSLENPRNLKSFVPFSRKVWGILRNFEEILKNPRKSSRILSSSSPHPHIWKTNKPHPWKTSKFWDKGEDPRNSRYSLPTLNSTTVWSCTSLPSYNLCS